jgi:hypothetical protein
MKKLTLILTAVFFSALINISLAGNEGGSVPKTVSISGTVVDKISQEAIAGALIKLEGTEIEVYTDLDGKFAISDIVPDTYTIKCSMISYNDGKEEIEIEETTKGFEIELQNCSPGSTAR